MKRTFRKKLLIQITTVLLFLSVIALLYFIHIKSIKPQYFNDEKKNVGIYLSDPSEFNKFKIHPDIVAWFETWNIPISITKLDICSKKQYAIPLITWQPTDIPLNEIASGVHDAYIRSFLKTVTKHARNTDVLIRFAHEMEMRPTYIPWYTWQAEEDPDAYIRAWRHVVTIAREINPRIKWIWAPNRANKYSAPFYPGDEYVDYVSVTLNLSENKNYYKEFKVFSDFYLKEGIRENLEAYGKKIIIGELGYSGQDSKLRQNYMQSVFDYFLGDPMIAGMVFFNSSIEPGRDYKFTDDPLLLDEFISGLERVHTYNQENEPE